MQILVKKIMTVHVYLIRSVHRFPSTFLSFSGFLKPEKMGDLSNAVFRQIMKGGATSEKNEILYGYLDTKETALILTSSHRKTDANLR